MPGEMTSMVELHDSDILRLEGVLRLLNANLGQRRNLEDFRREIVDRFAEAGFRVEVKVWQTATDGMFSFDIEIRERLEGRFDPDRMVHEVTRDILDLGEGGVIKTGGGVILPGKHTHFHKN